MRWLVLAVLIVACGDDSDNAGSDVGVDAAASDASDANLDDGEVATDVAAEACSEEGATRAGTCGNCGSGQETCEGGLWVLTGDCLGEGECAAGEVDVEAQPMCAERSRLCSNECAWLDWEESAAPGVCEPGAVEGPSPDGCDPGLFQERTCSSECRWVAGECSVGCPGSARTSPADAEELCIPEGPFMRGDAELGNAIPVSEVVISAFYLDRYPVTNRRYRECVDAGECTPPVNPAFAFSDTSFEASLVQGVSHQQAIEFCGWDGGRRLASEAEWEKAARGPAPRLNVRPWGDELPRCDLVLTEECPDWRGAFASGQLLPYDYDELPGTRSWYGAERMLFGGFQWVADGYDEVFYTISPSTDPVASGDMPVARGHSLRIREDLDGSGPFTPVYDRKITSRRWANEDGTSTAFRVGHATIRCARSAE